MRRPHRIALVGLAILAAGAIASIAIELDRAVPRATELSPPAIDGPAGDATNPHDAGAGGSEATHRGSPEIAHTDDDVGVDREVWTEIKGRVVGRGERPIPDARVRIAVEAAGLSHSLGAVASTENGTYRAQIPALPDIDPQAIALATVVVCVDATGYQPRTLRQPLVERTAASPPRTLVVDCRMTAGDTLEGRTVDRSGKAVRRARLVLFGGTRDDDRSGTPAPRTEVESDADGRFRFGFASGGAYHLWARKDGVGSARIDALELTPGENRLVGDVVLSGAGTLAGSVRYPDGSPVRDLALWAVPESVAHDAQATALAALRAPTLEGGDGLFYGTAVTDERGEFRIAGLSPGRFALRAPIGGIRMEPQSALYGAPSDAIRLTIDAYRLRVFVRSSTGAPLRGAVVACASVDVQSDGSLETGHIDHATAEGAEALAVFDVTPEQSYALSASAPGSRGAEDLVILAPREFELERTLVLERASSPGRLHVTVSGARGETLGGVRVALLTPLTAEPIAALGLLRPDERGDLPPIPAGRYLVEVGFDAVSEAPPMHFPVRSRETVEIESGRASDVLLVARAGGRLEIATTLAGTAPPTWTDDDPRRAVDPEATHERWMSENGAQAELASSDGRSGRVLQFLAPATTAGGKWSVRSRIAPGDIGLVEELLEPGIYVLRVQAPGFKAVETSVEVTAAVIRRVDVVLRPE